MDGVLIIDKPAGLTSHAVVARVRRILSQRRAGHTGTLDPFATGVLVVLLGRATRLAQFLAGAEKEYEAVIRFGFATETGDCEGVPLKTANSQGRAFERVPDWSEGEIEEALAGLRGEIEQIPPMYSAKKVEGQKLYELARRGIRIERRAARVRISELETVVEGGALLLRHEDGTCDLGVRVVCSAGTYVRTLAETVGERLGVGAHLAALRRTRAGQLSLARALTLEELEERAHEGALEGALLSMSAALSNVASVHLTAEDAQRTRHGVAVNALRGSREEEYLDGQWVRMLGEGGDLIAVGTYEAETGSLRPRVVLASPENKD